MATRQEISTRIHTPTLTVHANGCMKCL